jgi:hypothetical protein
MKAVRSVGSYYFELVSLFPQKTRANEADRFYITPVPRKSLERFPIQAPPELTLLATVRNKMMIDLKV